MLSLNFRRLGKIAFLETAEVTTDNWLVEKPHWLTDLSGELDQVREVAGITQESLVHKAVRPLSRACAVWDEVKERKGCLIV